MTPSELLKLTRKFAVVGKKFRKIYDVEPFETFVLRTEVNGMHCWFHFL